MKDRKKLFFIISLLGILTLLFLTTIQKPIVEGKIKSIQYGNNRIIITLENTQEEIILFSNELLPISEEQEVSVYGTRETYQNKTQIIANHIKCLNC